MADLYHTEVTVDPVTYTAHAPADAPGVAEARHFPWYVFTAADVPSGLRPAIRLRLVRSTFDGGLTYQYTTEERFGFASSTTDFTFSLLKTPDFTPGATTTYASAGENGSNFLGGGTLSIDKDETNGWYAYTGLLGSSTILFSDTPGVLSGPLIAYRLAVQGASTEYGGGANNATSLDVPFHDFWAYKNAVLFQGASLASGDRGTWAGGTSPYEPWILFAHGANTTITNPDTATTIDAGIDAADVTDASGVAIEYRNWDTVGYGGAQVDLIRARDLGAHWRTIIQERSSSSILWGRTHDKGVTWATGTVFGGFTSAGDPSINYLFGRLVVAWGSGTSVYQSLSTDLGNTWSSPVAISITGTHPRHLVDPDTGFSWYFYIDGTDLKVKRSGDLGASFIGSTVTVAAGIGAQTVTAQLALDGSLIVGYIVAGTWTQKRSTDLGLSFS